MHLQWPQSSVVWFFFFFIRNSGINGVDNLRGGTPGTPLSFIYSFIALWLTGCCVICLPVCGIWNCYFNGNLFTGILSTPFTKHKNKTRKYNKDSQGKIESERNIYMGGWKGRKGEWRDRQVSKIVKNNLNLKRISGIFTNKYLSIEMFIWC